MPQIAAGSTGKLPGLSGFGKLGVPVSAYRFREMPQRWRKQTREDAHAALTFASGTAAKIPESIGGLAMPRRIMLSAFAVAVSGMTASAADLPTQSRLGAIFAEPAEAGTYTTRPREYSAPIIAYNLLPNPPWNRGGYYYGSSWSYYYPGPYYGGPYDTFGGRLPYVCGFYGYC